MSDEKTTTKTRTMDEASSLVAAGAHNEVDTPRFIPSGINSPLYRGTRIRKYQRNQSVTVVAGLAEMSVFTRSDLRSKIAGNEVLKLRAANYLQICLVGPEKKVGAAQLFRKGDAGLSRILQELKPAEIAAALCRACEQVAILEEEQQPAA